ncbi:restriction endonuclease subunit S, partial [Lacicoccus alkaliphilus]|uniref:restriction endonuclease subunit S n=1 Tax=Lacicoccus alkaliphilus TaxID=148453 RepID=UPI0039EE35CE
MSKEEKRVPELRFKGFSDDWEQRKLNMVFQNFIVPMRDKPKEFSGEIPWTRIEDIQGRYLEGSMSGKYVSEDTIKSMNLKVIPKGSIIISVSATFGVVAIVTKDLITNQTFIGLTPKPNYNIDFLYSFFKSSKTRRKMKNESAGSTIFYITRKNIENMIGSFPTYEEQDKIGELLKSLDTMIDLHQRKINILKRLKQEYLGLMFTDKEHSTP